MEFQTETSSSESSEDGCSNEVFVSAKNETKNPSPEIKPFVKKENEFFNENETNFSNFSSFSLLSLWRDGPRRSAFRPYKSRREVSPPRPTSASVITKQQQVKVEEETISTELSWFTLAGRGELTIEELKEMVAQGKDIDCVDDESLSALMWAAFHGQTHTVENLLKVGTAGKVEVDRQGMWGETALMLAACNGHYDVVRVLIHAGADVNHQDHSGQTALMCAVHGDHHHTVNELLENDADFTIDNNKHCNAYDIAVDQKSYESKKVLEQYIISLITSSNLVPDSRESPSQDIEC